MKRLTLIRHAKSSWKDLTLADIDRPLNKRGERDAPMMGQRLAEQEFEPDLMVSSPAVRAMATAEAIAEKIGYTLEEIVEEDQLYHASVMDWLEVIWSLDDSLEHVVCFGHNPGLTELVYDITPLDVDNVPTCGIIDLEYDSDSWADVGRIRPVSATFDYPKKGVW
jgi:phosphohistidine phosphatase